MFPQQIECSGFNRKPEGRLHALPPLLWKRAAQDAQHAQGKATQGEKDAESHSEKESVSETMGEEEET